jgi:hypothetical protein
MPVIIHDYNQTKFGVDIVDQCVNNYTVRRTTRRWPMVVFYNMIDIAAINAMTVFLCQNPDWNKGKSHIRRIFLEQLSKSLTNYLNERRSQQPGLKPKEKLALQSLGYDFTISEILSNKKDINGSEKREKKMLSLSKSPRTQGSTSLS